MIKKKKNPEEAGEQFKKAMLEVTSTMSSLPKVKVYFRTGDSRDLRKPPIDL